MKALITGASSGIGRDMAIEFANRGIDLILVARRKERLEELKNSLNVNIEIIPLDISSKENCYSLYEQVKDKNIGILINNAGFGVFGKFDETDLEKEINMIDLNITALHILTKLFLKDFKKRNSGYILNVASSAAFSAGPLLSSYYATKNYVYRLTEAIYEELRRDKANVYISALCPGPVDTEFNDVANVKFGVKSLTSKYVAEYAIKEMFKRKLIIVPGFTMKIARIFQKIMPEKIMLRICYNIQKKKEV